MFVRQFKWELERIQWEKNESLQVKVFLPLAQKNPPRTSELQDIMQERFKTK